MAGSLEQITQVDQQIERLKADIATASTARRAIADADASEIRVDEPAFSELRRLESKINIGKAQLDAVATQLDFELLPDTSISLGVSRCKVAGPSP